jgi:uncharacterized phage protein (TIGR01671 family)
MGRKNMREILFRGKRTDNGEWVEGGYSYCGKDNTHFMTTMYEDRISYIGDHIQVDPSTIGQFTGLTDKNGKKIWEGDIIRVSGYSKRGYNTGHMSTVALVTFDRLCWSCGSKSLYNYSTLGEEFSIEVIGNIQDNPDLMP